MASFAVFDRMASRHSARFTPPRSSRFGSPLVLSHLHWVQPKLLVEVKYLSWTDDNLLRQVIYRRLREDKPPTGVRRLMSYPKSDVSRGRACCRDGPRFTGRGKDAFGE